MANRRIEMFEYKEVIHRLRQGQSARAIAKAGVIGRKKAQWLAQIAQEQGWLRTDTDLPDAALIAKAIGQQHEQQNVAPAGRPSGLGQEHLQRLRQWVEMGLSGVVIHATLQRDHGVSCHYSSIRRAIQAIKRQTPHHKPTVILDFRMGEAAQVDFGAGPFLVDPHSGQPRRTWFFVMTLCASRHQYVEFVWDQTVKTWLRCHQHAFEFFGGVTERVIIDNAKCAITKAVLHETQVQRAYGELAQGYSFIIEPCAPADPQKKGRVESGVKYVKTNFLPARQFKDLADLNEQARRWVIEVAGQRTHGSTYAKPIEQFAIEQPLLRPLPARRVDVYWYAHASVHRDCHVQYDKSLYSVPYRHIGQQALLRISANTLDVFVGEDLVASHVLCRRPGQRQTNQDHLPEAAVAWAMQSPQWCKQQAKRVGPHCLALVLNMLGDRVMYRLRTVQGILRLRHTYGDVWLERGCERCGVVDVISPKTMRSVIETLQAEQQSTRSDSGIDDTSTPAYEGKGRFARDTRQMMTQ